MKTKLQSKVLFFIALAAFATFNLKAQNTITSTVIVQPCNNNGQVGVTVIGLTPPINYTYQNWQANLTIVHNNVNSLSDIVTGLPAYQYYGTNYNFWSVSASSGANSAWGSFVLLPPFSDTIKVNNAVCPALGTVQATQFSGGTPPYSCLWTNTTTNISYNTNPAIVPNGTYSVVITDGAGCTVRSASGFSTFPINVQSQSGIIVNITGTAANCTNGTASVTASGGTAPYTFLWNTSAVTPSISGLVQGQYSCIVTDAIGCQSTGYYYLIQAVTINYNSSITQATCLQNNGSVTSFITGGTAPYTFLWSNGANTQNISGLLGGQNYNLQITDANGCIGNGSAYVGVSTPINVTYTATASSCTAATGSATITASGGLSPYTVVWNTFPSTNGNSIANKPVGTYMFTVHDANGCVQSGSAYIPPSSTINANINNSTIICPATTGNLQVSVSGSAPPFTYLWSNAATTNQITGALLGYYSCVITDAAGCSVTKGASILQGSPFMVGFSTTPATCLFSNNGSATAVPLGGTAPYTYTWSPGGQNGATANNLTSGNYFVTVKDANGCYSNYNNSMVYVGYNALNNSCYCTITGTVYADANSNCVKNTGENGISNIQIQCSSIGYAYTNANGVYSFLVPSGTYTISESVQPFYPLAPCQNNNQVVSVTAASNCINTVNFANNVIPVHDLHIITSNHNSPVPGNIYIQGVIVQNEGTIPENTIKVGYQHDGQLNYNNAVSWTFTQPNAVTYPNWYRINTGFASLNPGANSASFINYNVPNNIPINTLVNFKDTTAHAAPISTTWLLDNTPWNNVNQHAATVVGSYDPNFKEVTPKGLGATGNITVNDSSLTYVVHFQNEGTYYAQNVVVIDSLDSDLRISSLRPGYSDHNYTVTVSETGVIKFDFKNIHLPWKSAYGDILSSGMFTYSIKLKRNLAIGTQIKNKAAIYFDYNEPIITNTTLNTIFAPTGLNELNSKTEDQAVLFPNPTTNYFNLIFESPQTSRGILYVYDLSGREVLSKDIEIHQGENNFLGNVSQLQIGVYLVQLKSEELKFSKKLIISK